MLSKGRILFDIAVGFCMYILKFLGNAWGRQAGVAVAGINPGMNTVNPAPPYPNKRYGVAHCDSARQNVAFRGDFMSLAAAGKNITETQTLDVLCDLSPKYESNHEEVVAFIKANFGRIKKVKNWKSQVKDLSTVNIFFKLDLGHEKFKS